MVREPLPEAEAEALTEIEPGDAFKAAEALTEIEAEGTLKAAGRAGTAGGTVGSAGTFEIRSARMQHKPSNEIVYRAVLSTTYSLS